MFKLMNNVLRKMADEENPEKYSVGKYKTRPTGKNTSKIMVASPVDHVVEALEKDREIDSKYSKGKVKSSVMWSERLGSAATMLAALGVGGYLGYKYLSPNIKKYLNSVNDWIRDENENNMRFWEAENRIKSRDPKFFGPPDPMPTPRPFLTEDDVQDLRTPGIWKGIGGGALATSALLGAAYLSGLFRKGRTPEEHEEYLNNKNTKLLNYLIPGLGAYNAGRRKRSVSGGTI